MPLTHTTQNEDAGVAPGACRPVPTRTSRREISETIARAFCNCMGKYKVSEEDCRGIFVEVANVVFDQDWKLESDLAGETKAVSADGKKRRRVADSLDNVFPSRSALRTWMEAAAILNLQFVATLLKNKPDDLVATMGFDDGKKAAGHRIFDIKATHLTMKNTTTGLRENYTTGYLANANHTPAAAAENLQCTINMLAILAGCTPDEIKDALDFWMSDRAGDVEPTLDFLGIEDAKRIKCCAHILLCIDEAIEKVLKGKERKIGIASLFFVSNAKFNLAHFKGSVLMAGQIALTKMLSPSHAKDSMSLYRSFTEYLAKKDRKNEFKGFVSNRFGRRADTCVTFLEYEEDLKRFFKEQVDTGNNMLWAAVGAYIKNDWFSESCVLYRHFAEDIIYPLMDVLGIDNHKDTPNQDRSWRGVRDFFRNTLSDLEQKRETLTATGVVTTNAPCHLAHSF